MNHDLLILGVEIAASLVALPWIVFITNAVFTFRTEIALLKQQIVQHQKMQEMLEHIIDKLDG